MVYLSSSKFSLAVLGNMGFAFALATYKIILRVRLGPRSVAGCCTTAAMLSPKSVLCPEEPAESEWLILC
jgi:hypothetical protein